jgi:hypothetical protein
VATKTVVCPGCGAAVPYGRLSCAGCGTLLASVAGVSRRAPKRSAASANGRGSAARRADQMAVADAAVSTASPDDARSSTASSVHPRSQPAVDPVAMPEPPAIPAADPTATTPEIHSEPEPPVRSEAVVPAVASGAMAAPHRNGDGPSAAPPAVPPILDDWTGPRPSVAKPVDGEEWAVVSPRPAVAQSAEPPVTSSVPGAYLSPSAVITADRRGRGTPLTSAPRPAVASAPAAGGPALSASAVTASAIAASTPTATANQLPSRWYSSPADDRRQSTYGMFGTTAAARPAEPTAEPRSGLLAHLHSPEGAGGWATAIGSILAIVAFVLPWAQNGVAGTQGDRTYLGQWGLANPAYMLVFAAAIAVLLLTIVPNRLPREARAVALPLLFGGLLLGLGWSYATGPFGTGPGVDAMALGAVLLVVGGLLDLRPTRKAATPRP